jgi:hypothetical protein
MSKLKNLFAKKDASVDKRRVVSDWNAKNKSNASEWRSTEQEEAAFVDELRRRRHRLKSSAIRQVVAAEQTAER